MLPKVGSNAFSRRASNPSAYLLDHDHQRIRKQKRPGDSESELGSGLRIGGDSARIVVRRAGDEARTEYTHQPWVARGNDAAARFFVFLRFGLLTGRLRFSDGLCHLRLRYVSLQRWPGAKIRTAITVGNGSPRMQIIVRPKIGTRKAPAGA